MIRPIEVEAREGYRIWLRYSDGSSGEIDLSHLAGRGVFAAWDEPGRFQQVRVALHRAIAWDAGIELCPDALYMQLTGKTSAWSRPAGSSPWSDGPPNAAIERSQVRKLS